MPKFLPTHPLRMYEEGTSFGHPRKTSAFFDDLIAENFEQGGVLVHVYRFQGTFDQSRDVIGNLIDENGSKKPAKSHHTPVGIQDVIWGENRDRRYDLHDIPRLKGVYQVRQYELEYARFGMNLHNDVIVMEFHTQTMERELGRRLIVGDVIELPHLREVDLAGRVANKWYEVGRIVWRPHGYDPQYIRHVHGVTLRPLRHQQEFLDLFERKDIYGRTLAEQARTFQSDMSIAEALIETAIEQVPVSLSDTSLLYFDPDRPDVRPDMYTDDGKPPNGIPVAQGRNFPPHPQPNRWFLRTDRDPKILYQFQNNHWIERERDTKRRWGNYNWIKKMSEFMSDLSPEDLNRDWELRSIHEVLTSRQNLSDPTGQEQIRRTPGFMGERDEA